MFLEIVLDPLGESLGEVVVARARDHLVLDVVAPLAPLLAVGAEQVAVNLATALALRVPEVAEQHVLHALAVRFVLSAATADAHAVPAAVAAATRAKLVPHPLAMVVQNLKLDEVDDGLLGLVGRRVVVGAAVHGSLDGSVGVKAEEGTRLGNMADGFGKRGRRIPDVVGAVGKLTLDGSVLPPGRVTLGRHNTVVINLLRDVAGCNGTGHHRLEEAAGAGDLDVDGLERSSLHLACLERVLKEPDRPNSYRTHRSVLSIIRRT